MHATLGNVRDHGNGLLAHCEVCIHCGELDLGELIERLGDETPLPNLKPLLRCTKCGAREGVVRIAIPWR